MGGNLNLNVLCLTKIFFIKYLKTESMYDDNDNKMIIIQIMYICSKYHTPKTSSRTVSVHV